MKKGLILAGILCSTSITAFATDWLTEVFSSNFDLNGTSVTFTPDGTSNYTISAEAITALPVDISTTPGETYVALADDSALSVPTAPGLVTYFGSHYSAVFIGSNGYITFGAGDYDLSASLTDHYDTPRVSMYWNDLNPAVGGTISYIRVSDPERFVVTYENVPEYGTGNPNTCTMQCEFFLDDYRIRLSWIDTDDMGYLLVGLSAGQGYDPINYVPTDLSAYISDDIDEDQILDDWEEFYFGHITNCLPLVDSDFDTFNNYQEYVAGTIPTDGTSYFRIDSMSMTAAPEMIFNWTSVSGRLYSILWTDDLNESYSTMATLPYPQNSYTSPASAVEGYYRVEVEMSP